MDSIFSFLGNGCCNPSKNVPVPTAPDDASHLSHSQALAPASHAEPPLGAKIERAPSFEHLGYFPKASPSPVQTEIQRSSSLPAQFHHADWEQQIRRNQKEWQRRQTELEGLRKLTRTQRDDAKLNADEEYLEEERRKRHLDWQDKQKIQRSSTYDDPVHVTLLQSFHPRESKKAVVKLRDTGQKVKVQTKYVKGGLE